MLALFGVTGCSRACGHRLLVLSASTKTQSSSQNDHNHDRSYKFQTISPPFVASCTGRLRSQGNNVSLVFFGCIAGRFARKFQIPILNIQTTSGFNFQVAREPLEPDFTDCLEVGVWGASESFLDHDGRPFVYQIEEFNYIRIPHSHATAAGGRSDLVLVLGAMDVDVAVACIGILLV